MKEMWNRFVFALLALAIIPFTMGSSCQLHTAMERVRDVHSVVVEGFQTTDTIVAPLFDDAGDQCIREAQDQNLQGQEGRDYATNCMSSWMDVEQALSVSRDLLAELEVIYDDIENGSDRYSDWQSIATRLLNHGRNMVRLLESLGVDIPDGLTQAIESICELTNCEE
jgi:hypothetical protein